MGWKRQRNNIIPLAVLQEFFCSIGSVAVENKESVTALLKATRMDVKVLNPL